MVTVLERNSAAVLVREPVRLHRREGILNLSLVVPAFNEEASVETFLARVLKVFDGDATVRLEIVFVNDGSTDATLDRLLEFMARDRRIRVVDLTRNFGKEAALTAGLAAATGDAVAPIDIDLQDPPELIPAMIEKWREGYEVVLAKRVNRDADPWSKRVSANWFYRIHNRLAETPIPENVGDFRLMDRAVVDALGQLPENCRFMKGLFSWVGFRAASVDYVRPVRAAGLTSFSSWKLWNFALDGITSFSTRPLKVWTYIGFLVSLISFAFAAFIVARTLLHGSDVPGYASLMVVVIFFGGLQLIGIGVLGEYLGRTYMETKRRPAFVVRRVFRHGDG